MTDDIVTRLRDIEHLQFKPRHSWQDAVGEAADEIERLRQERDHYRSMTTFMAQFMSASTPHFRWADEKTIRDYFEKRMSQ